MDKTFNIVSILEGLSYIMLLFIAVPIKYMQGNDAYVKMLGMPHGLLFVLYLVLAYLLKDKYKWNFKTLLTVWLLAIVPFGTFFVKKYMNN